MRVHPRNNTPGIRDLQQELGPLESHREVTDNVWMIAPCVARVEPILERCERTFFCCTVPPSYPGGGSRVT